MPTPASKPPTGSCWPTPRMKAVSVVLVPRDVLERDVGVVSERSVMSIAPLRLERLARISGDGDRHVLQVLLAAAGGDDDVALVLGRPRLGGGRGARRSRLVLGAERRGGGQRGERGADLEGGGAGGCGSCSGLLAQAMVLGFADTRQRSPQILGGCG